ncbi:MAG: DUF1684 domain-containing protein [Saprospiraceae bacterium]|nr:DUF1684 domain-containing protein [Saprospiraceae bacterium]
MRYFYFLCLFILGCSTTQVLNLSSLEVHKEAIIAHQKQLNHHYKDSLKSPLKEKDRLTFISLDYFDINPQFRVIASFKRKKSKIFKMKTSGTRTPEYRKYGVLSFELKGKKFKLTLYQNMKLIQKKGFEDYLFLPFTDASNGNGSYGGGRYIDFRVPNSNQVILDFNKAYNPYCAYNSKYSCPIPPLENDIEIAIEAGVKIEDH